LCLLRDGRQVRTRDLPDSILLHASARHANSLSIEGEPLQLNLDDGLSNLTRQIVQAALSLEAGDTVRASARLKISVRTVQRYLASGRASLP